jgi:hypothetical protein
MALRKLDARVRNEGLLSCGWDSDATIPSGTGGCNDFFFSRGSRITQVAWLQPRRRALRRTGRGDLIMKRHSSVFSAFIAVVLLTCAGAVRAQDSPADSKPANVAGTWTVSFETQNGTMTQTLTLSQDGSTLTGTIGGERGTADVKGTVSGSSVSFSATRKGERGTFIMNYTGTADGDTIKGTISGGGGGGRGGNGGAGGNGDGGGGGNGGGRGGHGGGTGHGNRAFTATRQKS